jgi:hypothetical protein
VAIPQFTQSSTDTKVAALDADLAAMRNAIELYFHEHTASYPGVIQNHSAGGGDPSAHSDEEDAWIKQLSMFSDETGNTSDTKSSSYPKGPYLKSIPANPLAASGADADGANVTTDAGPLSADASPTTGWKASNATGNVIANVAAYEGH